jgi:hypothetical protein
MELNIFTKKKVFLYNTFNIHENATLPLHIYFLEKLEEDFQIV